MIGIHLDQGSKLLQLTLEEWCEISKESMRVAFATETNPATECTYAFLLVNHSDVPMAFVTVREQRAGTAYLQFGGVFEKFQNKRIATEFLPIALEQMKEYKKLVMRVEAGNVYMLRLALNNKFLPSGFVQDGDLHFVEMTRRQA